MRARMERHRADPVCAGCHQLMDPIGLVLERFDGIGQLAHRGQRRARRRLRQPDPRAARFRARSTAPKTCARPFSASPSGSSARRTEKLMTYALGRA